MQKIVVRVSNRAIAGLPLCGLSLTFLRVSTSEIDFRDRIGRNEEFLALAIDFAVDFMKSSLIIRLFPRFLKP